MGGDGGRKGGNAASCLPFSWTSIPPLPISVSSLIGSSGDSQGCDQCQRFVLRPPKEQAVWQVDPYAAGPPYTSFYAWVWSSKHFLRRDGR